MFAKMIWWTRPPDTITSGRAETDGVPINAPRPLPRPVRAMRLRLREHSVQRKPQSAMACDGKFGRRSSATAIKWSIGPHASRVAERALLNCFVLELGECKG